MELSESFGLAYVFGASIAYHCLGLGGKIGWYAYAPGKQVTPPPISFPRMIRGDKVLYRAFQMMLRGHLGFEHLYV